MANNRATKSGFAAEAQRKVRCSPLFLRVATDECPGVDWDENPCGYAIKLHFMALKSSLLISTVYVFH